MITALNHQLFLELNASEGIPPWLLLAARHIAVDILCLLPVLLAALWLWSDLQCRRAVLRACLAVLLALSLNYVIGALWPAPRPFVAGAGHTWLPHTASPSFPSNHMTILTCAALSFLHVGMTRLGGAILVLAVAVAWSRVFMGVHFPLDMAGAVLVAGAAHAFVSAAWTRGGEPLLEMLQRAYRRVGSRLIAARWIRF